MARSGGATEKIQMCSVLSNLPTEPLRTLSFTTPFSFFIILKVKRHLPCHWREVLGDIVISKLTKESSLPRQIWSPLLPPLRCQSFFFETWAATAGTAAVQAPCSVPSRWRSFSPVTKSRDLHSAQYSVPAYRGKGLKRRSTRSACPLLHTWNTALYADCRSPLFLWKPAREHLRGSLLQRPPVLSESYRSSRTLVGWEDRRPGVLLCIPGAIHSLTRSITLCWMPGGVPASEETARHKAQGRSAVWPLLAWSSLESSAFRQCNQQLAQSVTDVTVWEAQDKAQVPSWSVRWIYEAFLLHKGWRAPHGTMGLQKLCNAVQGVKKGSTQTLSTSRLVKIAPRLKGAYNLLKNKSL